ncbi:MAG: hypothetical protein E6G17_00065, partial [Actinobacteria bacterium]
MSRRGTAAAATRWLVVVLASVIVAGGCASRKVAAPARPTTTQRAVPPAATSGATVPSTTATVPFVSPIGPDNRPIPVAGDVNGEMPARDLVGVAKNCVASRAAGPSLGLLLATARNEGVVLGTEQCYRPLSDEVAVRQHATAAGNSACAAPVVTSPSGTAKGTSMHGWGKAADFSDIRGSVAFGSPGDHFLNATAARF